MTAYLRLHEPAIRQFRSPRRARPTGCTVLHTAESFLDEMGEDSGAESVARYMVTRTTFGSYHDLVDSDSVVHLVEYGDQAYQDGTGSNPWALSISFACRTTDWTRMGPERRAAYLANGARAFASQQAWLKANGYPTTPLRRISRAESERGVTGFISHADRDPSRRSDPGVAFPWTEFFAACRKALGETTAAPVAPAQPDVPPEDSMVRVNIDQPGHVRHGWTYLMAPGIVRHLNGEEDGAWRHVPLVTRNARQADVMRSNMLASAVQASLSELTADADQVRETLAALPDETVAALRAALDG